MTRVIAWDTETALIRPALLAPPLVCVTYQIVDSGNIDDARIVHQAGAEPLLREWLTSDCVLVGHNVAYDMAVVAERFPSLRSLIFDAYDANRITDTKIRQQLLDIAAGMFRGRLDAQARWITHEYTLEALARRCAGMQLQKDAWRLSYGEFLDVPLERWIERAREVQARAAEKMRSLEIRPHAGKSAEEKALKKEIDGLREMVASQPEQCLLYPLKDAEATLAVYQAQQRHADYLHDEFRQTRAAFAFHLSSAWGLRTNAERVSQLRAETEEDIRQLEAELVEAGLVRKDGSRDTKKAAALMIQICRAGSIPIRRTASHTEDCPEDGDCHICLDADACHAVEVAAASNDALATQAHILGRYAELSTKKKVLSNDCELLAKGAVYPIHPRYDLAETGRATTSPNVQNFNRGKKCRVCDGVGQLEAA